MDLEDALDAVERLGAEERGAWGRFEQALVALGAALRADADTPEVARLLAAVSAARVAWSEAGRRKQALTGEVLHTLNVAVTTRTPRRGDPDPR